MRRLGVIVQVLVTVCRLLSECNNNPRGPSTSCLRAPPSGWAGGGLLVKYTGTQRSEVRADHVVCAHSSRERQHILKAAKQLAESAEHLAGNRDCCGRRGGGLLESLTQSGDRHLGMAKKGLKQLVQGPADKQEHSATSWGAGQAARKQNCSTIVCNS